MSKSILLISLVLLNGCTCTDKFTPPVKYVGGCSQSGLCGVQYEDGTFGREYHPVVGAIYKHRKCE